MIDIWLIFTLFIPFAEVILHTKLALMKQRLEEKGNAIMTRGANNGNAWTKVDMGSKDIKMIRFSIISTSILYIG